MRELSRDSDFEADVARIANGLAGAEVVPEAVSCHWLRHTFIIDAVESGMPVPAVAHYVGHDDIKVTMKVYYDCHREYMRTSVAMLDHIEEYATRASLEPREGLVLVADRASSSEDAA